MPELPEVEVVKKSLKKRINKLKFTNVSIINKKLREKLGINAKQRAENELSWKIISDKYLSIIKSLTN